MSGIEKAASAIASPPATLPAAHPGRDALGTHAPTPTKEVSFGQVLKALGDEAKRGERLVERASHVGGDLSAGDLLALQAGVYRWVEVVDLASKLVDRATQAAKQVTQSSGG